MGVANSDGLRMFLRCLYCLLAAEMALLIRLFCPVLEVYKVTLYPLTGQLGSSLLHGTFWPLVGEGAGPGAWGGPRIGSGPLWEDPEGCFGEGGRRGEEEGYYQPYFTVVAIPGLSWGGKNRVKWGIYF